MNKLIAVIRREYLARVRSKWFIITTVLAPVLLIGAMALPLLLATRQVQRPTEVSVVDETGVLTRELLDTAPFRDGRLRYHRPPAGDPKNVRDQLRQQVLDQRIAGYVYIPADLLEGGSCEYWGQEGAQTVARSNLASAINTAVRRLQASRLGLDSAAVASLTREVKLDSYRVTGEGATRERGQTVVTAQVLAMLIYVVVLLYGAMMLRAAVAEKASKTVEVILSSVRPWQLMLGKTLGVGAVGLTQIGVWLAFLGLLLLYAAGTGALAQVEVLQNLPLGPDTLLLFLGLFLTGYFLFGGMYASMGAIANTEQEAAQLQVPVTLVAIIPVLVVPIVLEAPASRAAELLSWIPTFTPVLFIARYVLGAVKAWEIPLVFALQIAAILLVAWVGGRIYRVGLLMTGKRPTLPELVRWVRHG